MGLSGVSRKMLGKVGDYIRKKVTIVKKGGTVSCLCITTFLMLIPLMVMALVFKFNLPYREYYVLYVDTQDEAKFTVNEKFLSLGLDSSVITEGFRHFNMTDPKLIKMIKYLSPAYLRVGGNQADEIQFSMDAINSDPTKYILSSLDWLKLYNLTQQANIDLIYDLNSLLRFENGSWNPENAKQMLSFSQDNGMKLDWELGNEPNSYMHKFNTSVNATQLGLDFQSLRAILNNYSSYNESLIIGPSTTRLRTKEIQEYFLHFLESGVNAVSALTFHHYYFSGENATWQEFLEPTTFNYLASCIATVLSVLEQLPYIHKPLWLGETSTAWHGGAPNLSDRFIGSFLWIDKLGLSASMGIDMVIRQSIFKGDYALLNDTYYPNPDWWVSILYKKLVGPQVITTQTEGNEKIRLYAHCAKPDLRWGHGSTVVVFGININDSPGYVRIKELRSNSSLVYVYELTSDGDLFSQFVRLNGKPLKLGSHLELPVMRPEIVNCSMSLKLAAYSITFFVFTDTNVLPCK